MMITALSNISIFILMLLVLQYSECEKDIILDALEHDIEEGFEDETLDVLDGHLGDIDDEDETLDAPWMETLIMMMEMKHWMLPNSRTAQAVLLFVRRNQKHPLPVSLVY